MKLAYSLTAAAAAVLLVSGAYAQSAKFNATWSEDVKWIQAEALGTAAPECTGDYTDGTGTMNDPCILAEDVIATLDVAQQKDLLIGVSGEIGLVTFTQAKGKSSGPTLGNAIAEGKVEVIVELRNQKTGDVIEAKPGKVTFAARLQELTVDLGGSDPLVDTEVLVSLLLKTTAAHHFNFIGPDLEQGTYDVVAIFDLSAWADALGEEDAARAKVVLGPRMVTVQEVRAAKDAFVSAD